MEASVENRPGPRYRDYFSRLTPGIRRVFTIQQPAAGADWQVAVPGGRKWRLLLARATLTTSAVAGNRNAKFTVTDGNVTLCRIPPAANQAAGLTVAYTIIGQSPGIQLGGVGTELVIGAPNIAYPGGFTLGLLTSALDVGDQWANVQVFIEELFEDDQDIATHRIAAEAEFLAAMADLASTHQAR